METIYLKDKWRDKKSMQMQNEVSGILKFNSSNIKQSYNLLYCYSDSRNLWTVMRAGGLAPYNLIQPTISLEMPVPSQGHYGFHSFPVVDWFCLFI
jgi:hypothetical protein